MQARDRSRAEWWGREKRLGFVRQKGLSALSVKAEHQPDETSGGAEAGDVI